jgi:phage shock protein C
VIYTISCKDVTVGILLHKNYHELEEEYDMDSKRLYRSREDKMIAGVCGGLGDYFGIDPVIIRIIFIILFLSVGSGILIYLLAWIIIPLEPDGF